MKNETAISNEEIIAALLNSGTIKAAAASVGLSERAMYDRMSDHEFKGQYLEAKADILRAAVCTINESLNGAIETIAEINKIRASRIWSGEEKKTELEQIAYDQLIYSYAEFIMTDVLGKQYGAGDLIYENGHIYQKLNMETLVFKEGRICQEVDMTTIVENAISPACELATTNINIIHVIKQCFTFFDAYWDEEERKFTRKTQEGATM